MSNYQDPLDEMGKRYQQQAMDRTLQKYQQFGEHERLLQNRLFHVLTVGLVVFLWKRSRTALFMYVIPFVLFLLSAIGVCGALSASHHDQPFSTVIGFSCWAVFSFALMVGSMWYGLHKAVGFTRAVSWLQMVIAIGFSVVAAYRAFRSSFARDPYELQSVEAGVAVGLMFVLFIVTVVADLIQGLLNKRAME